LSIEIATDSDSVANTEFSDIDVDGRLVLVPVYPEEDVDEIERKLKRLSKSISSQVILATQTIDGEALNIAHELEIWRAVQNDCAALRVDEYATQELAGTISSLSTRLLSYLTNFYRFGEAGSSLNLINQGHLSTVGTAAELSRWTSSYCDDRFPDAPTVSNELINRQNISSQAATARTRLAEAMLLYESEENLAIAKTPPEKAIYLTVLKESGIHRRNAQGNWFFASPVGGDKQRWKAAWDVIEQSMQADHPITVADIVTTLRLHPFGLRRHPSLVVIVAVIIANKKRIAIRENGTFLTELTAPHVNRLCKAPQNFDLRAFDSAESDKAMLSIYEAVFELKKEDFTISAALRAVYDWYLKISTFVVQTGRLSEHARGLLQAISKSGEPIALLSRDIPIALGVKLSNPATSGQLAKFQESLTMQVELINSVESKLNDDLRLMANKAFELPANSQLVTLRQQMLELFEATGEIAGDTQLNAVRLRTVDDSRSDSKWFESLVAMLGEKPMSTWTDETIVSFESTLYRVGSTLNKLAALRQVSRNRRAEAKNLIGIHIIDALGQEQTFTVNKTTQINAQEDAYKALKETLSNAADPKSLLAQLLSEYANPEISNAQSNS